MKVLCVVSENDFFSCFVNCVFYVFWVGGGKSVFFLAKLYFGHTWACYAPFRILMLTTHNQKYVTGMAVCFESTEKLKGLA